MNKEMVISSTGHETSVAILEDDLVTEVFIERERQRGVVGNVYKGRVSTVLPGMQSAFVDIGLERDGFLYVSEVLETPEELAAEDEDERTPPGGPPDARQGDNGRSDRARGKDRDRERAPEPKIEDLLKQGQEILVQVVKEPLGTKGARITSHVSLPGRFLVFMPTGDHIGVSRKIDSREERARLRGIVREFRQQQGLAGGVIIRTAATDRPREDIVSDLSYFQRLWNEILQKTEATRARLSPIKRTAWCPSCCATACQRITRLSGSTASQSTAGPWSWWGASCPICCLG